MRYIMGRDAGEDVRKAVADGAEIRAWRTDASGNVWYTIGDHEPKEIYGAASYDIDDGDEAEGDED